MRTILLLLLMLILFGIWGMINTARGDESSPETFCEASLLVAQFARQAAISGNRDEEIAFINANYIGGYKALNLKLLRWGFAFYSSSEEQLEFAFLKSCGNDPFTMPEVDQRT